MPPTTPTSKGAAWKIKAPTMRNTAIKATKRPTARAGTWCLTDTVPSAFAPAPSRDMAKISRDAPTVQARAHEVALIAAPIVMMFPIQAPM